VIIPVFNEKGTISEIIEKVRRTDIGEIKKEVIIVDDKSTDGTRELLKTLFNAKDEIKVIFHEKNRGKGAAIRTGFAESTGDIMMIQAAGLILNNP